MSSFEAGVGVSRTWLSERLFLLEVGDLYSGNHSPVHPLDTLLTAAEQLASDPEIVICFIGGGSEWRKIKELIGGPSAARYRNLLCLPYQPLQRLVVRG